MSGLTGGMQMQDFSDFLTGSSFERTAERLVQSLKSLPGLGYRSAEKIALHLLVEKPNKGAELIERLVPKKDWVLVRLWKSYRFEGMQDLHIRRQGIPPNLCG